MVLAKKKKKNLLNFKEMSSIYNTMFLGVVLGDNLTWKSHISLLASNLSKSTGIIHKSWFYLPTHSPSTLYNAMIFPYFILLQFNLGGGGYLQVNPSKNYCNLTETFTKDS